MVVSNEADVNEILLALNIVNGNWKKIGNKLESQKSLADKKTKLDSNKVTDLEGRAKAMAKKVQSN